MSPSERGSLVRQIVGIETAVGKTCTRCSLRRMYRTIRRRWWRRGGGGGGLGWTTRFPCWGRGKVMLPLLHAANGTGRELADDAGEGDSFLPCYDPPYSPHPARRVQIGEKTF